MKAERQVLKIKSPTVLSGSAGDFLKLNLLIMEENNWIIRIPKKYWELLKTISNDEVWKIFKCIFNWDCQLEWISKIYYNLIKADIIQIENKVNKWKEWWKKWGRPIEKKPLGLWNLGLWNKKPLGIEKNNPSIIEYSRVENNIDKYNKENIKEKLIELYPNNYKTPYIFFENLFLSNIDLQEEVNEDYIKKIYSKLTEIFDIRTDLDNNEFIWELLKFIEYHSYERTEFKSTVWRLNTWFITNHNKKWKK